MNIYKIKLIIKKIIMLVKHPILTFKNIKSYFYIGKNFDFKSVKGSKFILNNETQIGKNAKIRCFDKKAVIEISPRCYIGDFFTILATDKIVIKKDNLFASNVFITTENHSFNPEDIRSYGHQPLISAPIIFEEGSWIGENTTFISSGEGLTIGKRCVIGAGSVVTRSIPDYCIAAGVPAKIIKKYNFETHKWERV